MGTREFLIVPAGSAAQHGGARSAARLRRKAAGHTRPQEAIDMPNIGPMELVVVLIIALVIIGPKKLPDVGRSMGRGMREFKSAVTGDHDSETPALTQAKADADAHVAAAKAEHQPAA
jgi:sec-independent protein translocase protein TatA